MPMKAAVLRSLGKPPRLEEFPDPKPSQGEVIVHIKAASLKNIDKMMARGSHYDSHRELPVVCGIDGVGILDDGTRVFCGGSRPPYGMMAERTFDIVITEMIQRRRAWLDAGARRLLARRHL